MKRLKYFGLFLAITGMLSCNIEKFEVDDITATPEEDVVPDEEDTTAVFAVAIDGENFTADVPTATLIDNAMNITGVKTSTGEVITLTLIGNTVGTYTLGVTQNEVEVNSASYVTSLNGTGETWVAVTDFMMSQGTVEITEIDRERETISGTFSFTGHHPSLDTRAFTNGVFRNISFSGGLVTVDSSNSFAATVDGTAFNQESINATLTELPGSSPIIGIVATKSSLETIAITLEANITPGDYEFTGTSLPMAQYNLSLTNANVGEGTFTITTHDTENRRITGTFSFIASPVLGDPEASFEITEGRFDVSYL